MAILKYTDQNTTNQRKGGCGSISVKKNVITFLVFIFYSKILRFITNDCHQKGLLQFVNINFEQNKTKHKATQALDPMDT